MNACWPLKTSFVFSPPLSHRCYQQNYHPHNEYPPSIISAASPIGSPLSSPSPSSPATATGSPSCAANFAKVFSQEIRHSHLSTLRGIHASSHRTQGQLCRSRRRFDLLLCWHCYFFIFPNHRLDNWACYLLWRILPRPCSYHQCLEVS